MFLGRNYGSKGIYKGFCFSCNGYFYVSAAGVNAEHDYMYQAADELTGLKTVTVNGDDVQWGYLYEYDNDFETCNIIKRMESSDERKHTFVKGKNYYEYMQQLFPASIISRYPQICPYCGSVNIVFSNVSCTTEYFYKETAAGKESERIMWEQAEQGIIRIVSDAEKTTVCSQNRSRSVDISLVINYLVSIEKAILLCSLRYHCLFREHLLMQRKLLHEYTEKRRPLRYRVQDMPVEPPFSFSALINPNKWKERKREIELYRWKAKAVEFAKAKYKEYDNDYQRNAPTLFSKARVEIENGNLEKFLREVPELTEKYILLSEDLRECEKHLVELAVIRKYLRSSNRVQPKYSGSFHALTLLAGYLNSGRCDNLEGKLGANNLLASEHLFESLHTNREIIQTVFFRENNQFALVLRDDIQDFESKIEELRNTLCALIDSTDETALCIEKSVYEKQMYTFYDEIENVCSIASVECLSREPKG